MSDNSGPNVEELVQFLLTVCQDRRKADAFRKDPETFLEGSGVSPELKALVISGQRAVEGKLGPAREGTTIVVVLIVVVVV